MAIPRKSIFAQPYADCSSPNFIVMTYVFFLILILNCLVIFAADALLDASSNTNSRTTVIVVPTSASSLQPNATMKAINEFEALYSSEGSLGSEKKGTIVGRKGVSQDFSSSQSGAGSVTMGESLFTYFDKS